MLFTLVAIYPATLRNKVSWTIKHLQILFQLSFLPYIRGSHCGQFCPFRGHLAMFQTFLIVTGDVLLASSESSPGMLFTSYSP